MPKKILIIGRSHHPDGKETADEIYKALQAVDTLNHYDLLVSHYKDLLFDIGTNEIKITDTKTQLDLAQVDSVLMTNWFSHASIRKDMAFALASFWSNSKTPFFNTEAFHNRSSSKLSQMLLAAQNSINIPRTIFSLNFDDLILSAEQNLKFPYILKDAQASRGKSNYLIHSNDEAVQLKNQHDEKHPFMAQQFIESERTDYRFFVAGGKISLILKRMAQGDTHVTNTSAGATAELLPPGALGEEIDAIVNKCSKLLHREVTGIDIIIDKNANLPYFLEANPIPQIATGSNTEQKTIALADALVEAANSKEV